MTATSLKLPRTALNDVDLPAVCVVTGTREGVEGYDVTLYAKPPWMPFALGAHSQVVGRLPFSRRGWVRWRAAEYGAAAVSIVLGLLSCGGAGVLLTVSQFPPLLAFLVGVFVVAGVVALPHVLAARVGPRCSTADASTVTLVVPSAEAAAAFVARFDAPPVADGICAVHADARATFTCPRCGAFGCDACARRLLGTDHPLCTSCDEKRNATVTEHTGRRLTSAAAGVFFLSLLGVFGFVFAVIATASVVALFLRWRTMPRAARVWTVCAAVVCAAALVLGSVGLMARLSRQ